MVENRQKQTQWNTNKTSHSFNSPKKTIFATPTKASLQLITNNFKIKSKNKGVIFTYKVDFIEKQGGSGASGGFAGEGTQKTMVEEQKESKAGNIDALQTFQKFKIIKNHNTQLKQIFEQYIFVGSNLFSTVLYDGVFTLDTTKPLYQRYYTIVMERVSEFFLDDLSTMKMEEHPFALSFMNTIIKSALRNSQLKQIGRIARFFDPSQAKQFQSVETWPGFFTSSWIFQSGLYLVIDNISKFLSVDNCLTIIKDRLKRLSADQVSMEFEGNIVMAKYGPSRTYKVNQIRWDMSPDKYTFDQGSDSGTGKKISMLEYFNKVYETKIMDIKQPLFEIKQKKQNIYLPPELCTLVGIPNKVRENKKLMADIKNSSLQRPHERIQSIRELNKIISKSKEMKEWNLEMSLEPDEIEAKILKRPIIYDKEQSSSKQAGMVKSLEDTSILRSIVYQPVHFEKWAIFCLDRDYQNAQYLQEKFYNLSNEKGFNIYVEYGDIISLRNHSQLEDFKEAIDKYFHDYVAPNLMSQMKSKKTQQQQQKPIPGKKEVYFFLVIIPDGFRQEAFYTALKNKINSDSPVISQFVQSKTINKDNDRIFMNIVRQINAKLGGDLWRMSFGKEISKKTMLIGIDVCHKGKYSINGFVATYDPFLCKYYTQANPQPSKGQEIISSSLLQQYYEGAFQAYKEYNQGELPDHIFVYRDGVGDSMRKKIIDQELEQLKIICIDEYGVGADQKVKMPEITLIVVNKRIRQRFFEKNGKQIINPPQGTFIDAGFVETEEVIDGKFDFYLVPHSVTQGAVKPTHFYVAENTSQISKETILNFTYALCYNYFNWPDSIKIPAPCMLADKIAIYRSEIGNIPNNVDLHKLLYFL